MPFGTIMFPIAQCDLEDNSESPKEQRARFALPSSILVFNPLVDDWANEVEATTWSSIKVWNDEHLAQSKSGSLWPARNTTMQMFFLRVKGTKA